MHAVLFNAHHVPPSVRVEDADDLMPVFRQYTTDMNDEYGTSLSQSPSTALFKARVHRMLGAICSLDEGTRLARSLLFRAAGYVTRFSAYRGALPGRADRVAG